MGLLAAEESACSSIASAEPMLGRIASELYMLWAFTYFFEVRSAFQLFACVVMKLVKEGAIEVLAVDSVPFGTLSIPPARYIDVGHVDQDLTLFINHVKEQRRQLYSRFRSAAGSASWSGFLDENTVFGGKFGVRNLSTQDWIWQSQSRHSLMFAGIGSAMARIDEIIFMGTRELLEGGGRRPGHPHLARWKTVRESFEHSIKMLSGNRWQQLLARLALVSSVPSELDNQSS